MRTALPVLLVDDEPQAITVTRMALTLDGIRNVVTCTDGRRVLDILKERPFGAMLLDLTMPYVSGEAILGQVQQEWPELPVIILTGRNEVATAVRCIKAGAFDYMVKPVEESRLVTGVRRALRMRELELENTRLREHVISGSVDHPEAFEAFITSSASIESMFRYVETVAPTTKPVLITGETGTGKEVIAQIVHRLSGVRDEFVAVNVAGLDDSVFSDTLFGHVKGAFTGADTAREGLIERAAGGTLFLDEIGDLPPSAQVKLLRLLQEREYRPLGADVPKRTDARVIVATNQDLQTMQRSGLFRKDLYFRLQTHHIHIPPLRERPDDIQALLVHFLDVSAEALGKKTPTPPRELITLLSAYHFPGNVRELEAMVFEAVSHHGGGTLSTASFREHIEAHSEAKPTVAHGLSTEAVSAEQPALVIPGRFPSLKEASDFLVQEALHRAKGNITVASGLLGISRPALSKRLRNSDRI